MSALNKTVINMEDKGGTEDGTHKGEELIRISIWIVDVLSWL